MGKFGRERRPFVEKCFDLLFLPQLHGILRVILEPLIGNLPIVGAVSMFFIRRPVRKNTEWDGEAGKTEDWERESGQLWGLGKGRLRGLVTVGWVRPCQLVLCPDLPALSFQTLDINWTGMTNLLDIPGLRYQGFIEHLTALALGWGFSGYQAAKDTANTVQEP